RDAAAGFGRDPDAMELVVRANVYLTDAPLDGERQPFAGSFEQVVDDLEATRAAGADEVLLQLFGDPTLDVALDVYARLAEALGAGRSAAAGSRRNPGGWRRELTAAVRRGPGPGRRPRPAHPPGRHRGPTPRDAPARAGSARP